MHHGQLTVLHMPQEVRGRHHLILFTRLHVAGLPRRVICLLLICSMNKDTKCSVCMQCSISIPLWKRRDVALSSGGGPFECDIEKSLMADFVLSGELIHTRWFSLLVKRKPDTKTEMKSLRCRTELHMCGQARVGVSVLFYLFIFFLLL